MEPRFKAFVVWLILNGKTEEALELLAKYYKVNLPKIKVGLPKRHRKNTLGCYTAGKETISVLSSDILKEPSIILHEFYHHMRMDADKRHKGTERKAHEFAQNFIEAYRSMSATKDEDVRTQSSDDNRIRQGIKEQKTKKQPGS